MALIKCSECGNEISDEEERCVYCFCPIEEQHSLENKLMINKTNDINKLSNKVKSDMLKEKNKLKNEREILNNISRIKNVAKGVNILFWIMFCIFMISSVFFTIVSIPSGDMIGIIFLFLSILLAVIFCVLAYTIPPFIKWKAYMLETNYYIYKQI